MKWLSLFECLPVTLACLSLAAGCSSDDSNPSDSNSATGSALGGSAGMTGSPATAGAGGSSMASAAGSGAGGSSSEAMSGLPLGAGGSAQTGAVGGGLAGAGAVADAGGEDAGSRDAGRGDAGNDGAVTYSKDIQPILIADCSPCHATLNSGGHNAASSYADAVRVADTMLNEIRQGSMPAAGNGNMGCRRAAPGSPGCVSVADFALIQKWVAAGTPQ